MADDEQSQIRYDDFLGDGPGLSFDNHWRAAQVHRAKVYDRLLSTGGTELPVGESLQIAQLEATLAVATALKEIHGLGDSVADTDD